MMKDYDLELHNCIKSLFKENEIKIEIRRFEDTNGNFDHGDFVGIRVTHLLTGKAVVCESYPTQIQNANIAILLLKKAIDETR